MTEFQTVPKPGFTSIARLITAPQARLPSRSPAPAGSRPCERSTRSTKPPEKPQGPSTSTPNKSNNSQQKALVTHPRHRYLIAREAIALGILTTLFLLTAITSELTARTNSSALYLLIPVLTFLALHLLCIIASQLALIAKPFQGTDRPGHRDLTRGIIILTLFTVYAVLRIIHPIADWFTPIAYIWLTIIAVDLIGRIIEQIASKKPSP